MAGYPNVRGQVIEGKVLADLTWLRVGGAADALFMPADEADLSQFLAALPPQIAVFPMGVGSNLIVRDGGLRAVVIRLGRAFADITVDAEAGTIRAGAAVLDSRLATTAAAQGLDLTFLRTIPGSVGGAVRMNAGCYGSYIADHLISLRMALRSGEIVEIPASELGLSYRSSQVPEGAVILSALFRAEAGSPEVLAARMTEQLARRDASQPVKDRSAGSTFRNPAGFSSTGRADDVHDLKAWKLIQEADMQGARIGGAQMSEMHANFMINTGGATAADLESLGEEVRKRVFEKAGIWLEWEIMRVGEAKV